MRVSANREPPERFLARLLAHGGDAPSLAEKTQMLVAFRNQPRGNTPDVDRALLERLDQLHQALATAREHLGSLKGMLDHVMAPPWHSAVLLRVLDSTDNGLPRLMVALGNTRRVVGLAEGLDVAALATGDEVFLNNDRTAIVAKSPNGPTHIGEVAVFDRHVGEGRSLFTRRGEESIAYLASPLQEIGLKAGDQVRIDWSAGVAYERIERAQERRYFLDQAPDVRPEQVGGQRGALDALLGALTTALVAPDKAEAYGMTGRRSILMVGPPGCGKTLMARVAATEIDRQSGRKCRFAVVKPAAWEDPYVGVTQQNIRQCFQSLKEAAQDSLAVLFLDELEAVGRLRGSGVGHHSDKFLAALLAELDGFAERSGVAIIAATNRKDLTDPALLERLSDVEIAVPRPDMRAAREILRIHLPVSMPFSPNGDQATATRDELIERAVSCLYAPNAENGICTLKFRDGKTRTLAARELMSGRVLEQICRGARHAAFLRDVRTGQAGLRTEDIDQAVADAIRRLSTSLTPRNAAAYLSDLPQDLDVVAVEPIARRVTQSHRYLNPGN